VVDSVEPVSVLVPVELVPVVVSVVSVPVLVSEPVVVVSASVVPDASSEDPIESFPVTAAADADPESGGGGPLSAASPGTQVPPTPVPAETG
jgi:hypothetical protein